MDSLWSEMVHPAPASGGGKEFVSESRHSDLSAEARSAKVEAKADERYKLLGGRMIGTEDIPPVVLSGRGNRAPTCFIFVSNLCRGKYHLPRNISKRKNRTFVRFLLECSQKEGKEKEGLHSELVEDINDLRISTGPAFAMRASAGAQFS